MYKLFGIVKVFTNCLELFKCTNCLELFKCTNCLELFKCLQIVWNCLP